MISLDDHSRSCGTSQAVFGALWGLSLAVLATFWISRIFNSTVIEITITLATAYLTFFSAEALEMSGVLAVVALGLFMGKEGKVRAATPSARAASVAADRRGDRSRNEGRWRRRRHRLR